MGSRPIRAVQFQQIVGDEAGRNFLENLRREFAAADALLEASAGGIAETGSAGLVTAGGLILRASSQGWGPTIVVQSSLGSGVSDVALAPGTWSLWATGGILTRLGGDAAIWSGPLARADSDADQCEQIIDR